MWIMISGDSIRTTYLSIIVMWVILVIIPSYDISTEAFRCLSTALAATEMPIVITNNSLNGNVLIGFCPLKKNNHGDGGNFLLCQLLTYSSSSPEGMNNWPFQHAMEQRACCFHTFPTQPALKTFYWVLAVSSYVQYFISGTFPVCSLYAFPIVRCHFQPFSFLHYTSQIFLPKYS